MLEILTMAAAKKIGADVVTIDMQDLMELTPDIFNKKGTGNPWPIDHLARGFNPFVAAPVPVEHMEDFLDVSAAGADDDADEDEDNDERDNDTSLRMFITQNQNYQNGQYVSSTTNPVLKENFGKFWTALLLAEPAPLTPSSGSSRLTTREKSLPKVLYLKDIADILPSPFGSMLLPGLANAVLTLRKAGHNIMVVAGHSPSLLSTQRQYDDEVLNLPNSGDSVTSVDEELLVPTPTTNILQKQQWPDGHRQENRNYQYAQISLASLTFDTFPGSSQSYNHIAIPPFLPPTGAGSSDASDSVDWGLQLQKAEENAKLLKRDKANRIKEINCRSLSAVLRFRGGLLSEGEPPLTVFGSLAGVDSEVWGFGKVYRIISNALGSLYVSEVDQNGTVSRDATLSERHVKDALETSVENVKLRKKISMQLNPKSTLLATPAPKPLFNPEDYSRYERKLLGSIVDPEKIKTTFKNTIIPPETIQTLQTMITLPLIRPQLFSYGLLQNEFLSGLLLFGPPGTGKTLLAKAVAKESGARMLEIKASDIFDMYVGEGEKNVSAVFSLARKLSPCVVFLDEVDSIFRARGHGGIGGGGGGGNSSQREILNQFMVEWDGLRSSGQNQGIVVMASTNRPFELDDAVLRRMPRRILVDLPSEQAREQILKVYLGQEQLEDGVDMKDLAKKTGFFSGSDLKNLCVSAALTSVREDVEDEVRSLQSATGESSSQQADAASDDKDRKSQDTVMDLSPLLNQYKKDRASILSNSERSASSISSTPVRVIKKRHFEKALAQITPSCSENMDSLTELRKWDGLYGDGGKGRRKVNKGIGFEVEHSSSTSPVGSSADKARQ
ncbi:hypothetical protein BGZ58_001682 [Dissophora ornata]|nr:hypothetical protein BGZ58_001682 [Dissophora ornata]